MRVQMLMVLAATMCVGAVSNADIRQGVSIESGQGLGYTVSGDRLWAGLSLYTRVFTDTPHEAAIEPRIFVNYDFYKSDDASLYFGGTYRDTFSLSGDKYIYKERDIGATFGIRGDVSKHLQAAAWIYLYGAHHYEGSYGSFPRDRNTSFDFGGMSLTYFF